MTHIQKGTMPTAYSIIFSEKGLSDDYHDMTLLSIKSFFWSNPSTPFILFMIGELTSLEESLASLKDAPLKVIKIPEELLPKGFWEMKTVPHSLRFSPMVHKYLPEGWIGYFDVDILHVRAWETPEVPGLYAVEDAASSANAPLCYKDLLVHYNGRRSQMYYNTGVLYFYNNISYEASFFSKVWKACLVSEADYPLGLAPWFDQHVFNEVVENNPGQVMELPLGHNVPTNFMMVTNPETRSVVTGSLRALYQIDSPYCFRYHLFSVLKQYRYKSMVLLAKAHFPLEKLFPVKKQRDLQVVVTDSPSCQGDFLVEVLPELRKVLPDATIVYVSKKVKDKEIFQGGYCLPWDDNANPKEQALESLGYRTDTLFLDSDTIPKGWTPAVHYHAMSLYDLCSMRLSPGKEYRGAYLFGPSFVDNTNVWVEGLSPSINNKVDPNGVLIKGSTLAKIKERLGWVFLPGERLSPFDGMTLGSMIGVSGGYAGFFPLGVQATSPPPLEYGGVMSYGGIFGTLTKVLGVLQDAEINSFWSTMDKLGTLGISLEGAFLVDHKKKVLGLLNRRSLGKP